MKLLNVISQYPVGGGVERVYSPSNPPPAPRLAYEFVGGYYNQSVNLIPGNNYYIVQGGFFTLGSIFVDWSKSRDDIRDVVMGTNGNTSSVKFTTSFFTGFLSFREGAANNPGADTVYEVITEDIITGKRNAYGTFVTSHTPINIGSQNAVAMYVWKTTHNP